MKSKYVEHYSTRMVCYVRVYVKRLCYAGVYFLSNNVLIKDVRRKIHRTLPRFDISTHMNAVISGNSVATSGPMR